MPLPDVTVEYSFLEQRTTGEWVLPMKCRKCGQEVQLASKEKPVAYAVALFRASMLCAKCWDAIEEAEEKADAAHALRQRVEESRLPDALHELYWNEMLTDSGRGWVIDQVKHWADYAQPEPRGLCLWGGVGAGKTRLAATAAWKRMEAGWHVRWVSMPILIAQLGAAFANKERQDAISALTGEGALIIDDLDKVKPSEWAINQVFAAIDTRIQAGAPILITTNKRPTEIGEQYGDAVMSRVAGLEVLELPGRDGRIELDVDAALTAQKGSSDGSDAV